LVSGRTFWATGEQRSSFKSTEVKRCVNLTECRQGVLWVITVLRLEPSDFQIFKGRYSLQRVTPLAGFRARYVTIFSYVEEPGMVGSPERTSQLYGQVLPIHL
jgi:hypothetical protein